MTRETVKNRVAVEGVRTRDGANLDNEDGSPGDEKLRAGADAASARASTRRAGRRQPRGRREARGRQTGSVGLNACDLDSDLPDCHNSGRLNGILTPAPSR
jgi:hypothetical protein